MKIPDEAKIMFLLFGQHIKKLREKRNIDIKELSEKTGIRKEYLKKIEKGSAYGVSFDKHITKIAKVLKVNFAELFNFE